jgi:NAD(P)-dependent dehydrogenase (short-subunit alcohol dehydrogenase family)
MEEEVKPSFDLSGKVALVTGASRGLGAGMAQALAAAGADLALASRTVEDLDRVAGEIRDLGRDALVIPADLSQVSQVQAMVTAAEKHYGQIDILVNNAGFNIRKPALEVGEEDWDRLHAVNLKAVFFACQAAAPGMISRGGGKIINVASLTTVLGFPNQSVYGASRGGVGQLTKALAVEWARHGINVNAIGPGYYETAQTRPLFEDPEKRAWIQRRIPVGRTGMAEDLAGALLFLASPASDYVTGQILFVDGGWLAG